MKTLEEMKKDVLMTFDNYDQQGTDHWGHEEATYDLAYQVGMLTKRVFQLNNKRFDDGLSRPELLELAADECADIIANTLYVAHELGIDIEQAWRGMLASDARKIEERT